MVDPVHRLLLRRASSSASSFSFVTSSGGHESDVSDGMKTRAVEKNQRRRRRTSEFPFDFELLSEDRDGLLFLEQGVLLAEELQLFLREPGEVGQGGSG